MRNRFVLDSFALLAFFLAQPGAMQVVDLFTRARRGKIELFLSAVNMGEVLYIVESRRTLEAGREALAAIESLPIAVVGVDQALAVRAARLKGSSGMGYMDCFVGALAQQFDASIVTGDRDFENLRDVQVHWLPSA